MSDVTETATESAAPEQTIEQIAAEVFGEAKPVNAEAPATAAAPVVEEPKPDPVAEKVAQRIAIAKRAELRAADQRRELATQQAEIDRQRGELAEQLKVAESIKAAKLSPSKALDLLGMSPKEFLEALAGEHEPEAVAKRVVSETQSETAKLKAELAELRAALEAKDHAVKIQELDRNLLHAQQEFVNHIEADAVKYPHLLDAFTPEEVAAEGLRLAQEHAPKYFQQFGEWPTNDVIAEYLEEQAKAKVEARNAWRTRIGQTAPAPSEGNTTGDLRATQPEKGPSPRTLTSRAASEKATAPPKWSQEQADEESLRILNAALKTG